MKYLKTKIKFWIEQKYLNEREGLLDKKMDSFGSYTRA